MTPSIKISARVESQAISVHNYGRKDCKVAGLVIDAGKTGYLDVTTHEQDRQPLVLIGSHDASATFRNPGMTKVIAGVGTVAAGGTITIVAEELVAVGKSHGYGQCARCFSVVLGGNTDDCGDCPA